MKEFITPQGLVNLKNYKYKSGEYTFLDNALNPYWEAVVKLVPMNIAPNLITFVGWIFIIASVVNIFRYDYTGQAIIPNYCFIFLAIAVWTYSTLDAIDGKQARRTKSSSPLGQLFDHGCDSFSTTFFILALAQVFSLNSWETFIAFITSQLTFWASSWIEYTTGVLLTNISGKFGITEGHIICTLVFIVTGIFGQDFWQFRLMNLLPSFLQFKSSFILVQWSLNLKIGSFLTYYFCVPLNVVLSISFFKTVLDSEDKLKPIKECFGFYFMLALQSTWLYLSIYDDYRSLILTNFGLLGSLLICKVIISSVTKMQIQFFHLQLIPLVVVTIMMWILQSGKWVSAQKYLFWIYLVVNVGVILLFLKNVINQITSYLGIYCFSIVKKDELKSQ